jgi:hypothetical protein
MNTFITPDALDKLLTQSGVSRPASQRAHEAMRSHVNKAAWQIFSRLLDVIRVSTDGSTIRPSHIYNLMRVVAMLDMPLRDGVTSRRIMTKDLTRMMRGGDPVLPGSYFDPNNRTDAMAYTGGDYTSLGGDADLVRAGLDSTYAAAAAAPCGSGIVGGAGTGTRTGSDKSGTRTGSDKSGTRTGTDKSGSDILSDASLNAMLAEYRARITSSLRLGKGSRTLITRVVCANLVALMRKNGKKALTTTLHSWKLIL